MAVWPSAIASIPSINPNSMRQATQHTVDRVMHWGETIAMQVSLRDILTRLANAEQKLASYTHTTTVTAGSTVLIRQSSVPFLFLTTATISGGSAVSGTYVSKVIDGRQYIDPSTSVGYWKFVIPNDYPGVQYRLHLEGNN